MCAAAQDKFWQMHDALFVTQKEWESLPAPQPTFDSLAAAQGVELTAFRKCVYLDPDQPAMHLHLGLALEASGDLAAARRSFAVARVALDACDAAVVEAMLDGYPVGELARLLDRKLVEIS